MLLKELKNILCSTDWKKNQEIITIVGDFKNSPQVLIEQADKCVKKQMIWTIQSISLFCCTYIEPRTITKHRFSSTWNIHKN